MCLCVWGLWCVCGEGGGRGRGVCVWGEGEQRGEEEGCVCGGGGGVVMVVLLTVCIDDKSVHTSKRLAPDTGEGEGPCPCGHNSSQAVCLSTRPPKRLPLPGVSYSDCSVATGKDAMSEPHAA